MTLTPDASAMYTVVLLTLMGLAWLMSFVPRCSHPACAEAHKQEAEKERRATAASELQRLHAFHDRFRPQPTCSLCQAAPKPDDPER